MTVTLKRYAAGRYAVLIDGLLKVGEVHRCRPSRATTGGKRQPMQWAYFRVGEDGELLAVITGKKTLAELTPLVTSYLQGCRVTFSRLAPGRYRTYRNSQPIGEIYRWTPRSAFPGRHVVSTWEFFLLADARGASAFLPCLLYTSPSPRDS